MVGDVLMFPETSDALVLGREALAMAGGDLLTACLSRDELKAEIVLAWLEQQIRRQPARALVLVRLAGDVVGDV